MNTIDSKEKESWWNTLLILQINSLNHYSQHSEVISILHLSLFHLSHSSIPYSLLLWRTDCYSFQSIRISVLPTLFIVIISMTVRYHHTLSLSTHQSILMDTKQCMITIRLHRGVSLIFIPLQPHTHTDCLNNQYYEVICGIRDTDSFMPFQFMITTNQAKSVLS